MNMVAFESLLKEIYVIIHMIITVYFSKLYVVLYEIFIYFNDLELSFETLKQSLITKYFLFLITNFHYFTIWYCISHLTTNTLVFIHAARSLDFKQENKSNYKYIYKYIITKFILKSQVQMMQIILINRGLARVGINGSFNSLIGSRVVFKVIGLYTKPFNKFNCCNKNIILICLFE